MCSDIHEFSFKIQICNMSVWNVLIFWIQKNSTVDHINLKYEIIIVWISRSGGGPGVMTPHVNSYVSLC